MNEVINTLLTHRSICPYQDNLMVGSNEVEIELGTAVAVNPGFGNQEHIKENLDIFNFELSKEEMEQISQLER